MLWLLVGVALAGAIGLSLNAAALRIIRPPKRAMPRTARDLPFAFDDVSFESDGRILRGWMIYPHEPSGCGVAVVAHGWASNSGEVLPIAESVVAGHSMGGAASILAAAAGAWPIWPTASCASFWTPATWTFSSTRVCTRRWWSFWTNAPASSRLPPKHHRNQKRRRSSDHGDSHQVQPDARPAHLGDGQVARAKHYGVGRGRYRQHEGH